MVNVTKRMRALNTRLVKIRVGPGAVKLPEEVTRVHLHFSRWMMGGHKGPRQIWRQYLPSLQYYNPSVSMTVSRTIPQGGPAFMMLFRTAASSTSTSSSSSTSSLSRTDASTSTIHLPTTLRDFLSTYPIPPYNNPAVSTPKISDSFPNQPSQPIGLSQVQLLKQTYLPTDNESLIKMISPMISLPSSSDPAKSIVFMNMLDRPTSQIWDDFVALTGAEKISADPKDLALAEELERLDKKSKEDSRRHLVVRAEIKKQEEMLKAAKETAA